MTDEQIIRDELVQILAQKRMHTNESLGKQGADADAILASPVIRRIQAEALREAAAADDFFAAYVDGEGFEFNRGVTHGADSLFDQLHNRADRIERGETA